MYLVSCISNTYKIQYTIETKEAAHITGFFSPHSYSGEGLSVLDMTGFFSRIRTQGKTCPYWI
jgi:hypothetical protein